MGIAGSWAGTSRRYVGAGINGTGINPIHAVRDAGRGRVIGTKLNLVPLGEPSDAVAAGLTSREIDWVCEDYVDQATSGESYRYQDDRPRWNQTTVDFRGATTSPAMGEQDPWGVYFDTNPVPGHPRPGPTGGMQRWLDTSHGESMERQHAIAVPTSPVSGGWMSKTRGAVARPESQEAGQPGFVWTINNASVQGQGLRESANERAVTRGTDSPRSAITSRTAGMAEKAYARSFGMGGGPGTPDMQPFQHNADYQRPFLGRTAATPPLEAHMFNTIEYRSPISRQMPADPYPGDPETGYTADATTDDGWGY